MVSIIYPTEKTPKKVSVTALGVRLHNLSNRQANCLSDLASASTFKMSVWSYFCFHFQLQQAQVEYKSKNSNLKLWFCRYMSTEPKQGREKEQHSTVITVKKIHHKSSFLTCKPFWIFISNLKCKKELQ